MLIINYVFFILAYTIGIYLFAFYNRLQEYFELFSCFACKEMDELGPIYDYIIVGSGSAGSTVALRLSEDKSVSVLVLEAGSSGNRLMDIPVAGPLLQQSFVDWQYQTVPQANACFALKSKKSNWPMGRLVGGTSRLNNMVYLRGHPNDFKEWYSEGLDFDFDYDQDVLAYFKKAENNKDINNDKYHGTNGHLILQNLTFVSYLAEAFLGAVKSLGFPIQDLNGENQTGFMKPQANLNFGSRWTTAHHLLKTKRSNLVIQTNSLVHKLLLKDKFEAYAVKYSYLGSVRYVRARRGIILCAGVIGTPKLLMLSGIGPRRHLMNMGIKPKINLPVGRNLQDHITTGLDLVILNTTLEINVGSLVNPFAAYDYFNFGTGPWTTTGCEAIGLLDCLSYIFKENSVFSDKDGIKLSDLNNFRNKILEYYKTYPINAERVPDLEFMVIPTGVSADVSKHLCNAIGINDKTWNEYFVPLKHHSTISILPIVLHSKSKGLVQLKNKNIYSKPLIDPKYLSHYEDVDLLLKGIEVIKLIISTEPMQKLGASLNKRVFPGCERFPFDTKPYWECYVQHLTLTVYHPVGTCKMGSIFNSNSVVDHNFQVHGTNNLYVADASVIPSLPSGNINAAVVMMAEKAAAIIKYQKFLNTGFCSKRELIVPKLVC